MGKITSQTVGYVDKNSYLYGMKTTPTYEELLALVDKLNDVNKHMADVNRRIVEDNKRKDERIAYLERMLYGAKRDKRKEISQDNLPSLFDDQFNQALDEKEAAIEKTVKAIRSQSQRRRERVKKEATRPDKYHYYGLEEHITVVYPQGVDINECDVIGKDITRLLHRTPAKLWVEVIERPILRPKLDKTAVKPRILQAPAPTPIIGGNHVAADLLAQLIVDKFVYHLPEYRQVKQYSDMGVELSTSTVNNWIHAVANKLYPLYETLCEHIRTRSYLQIDEVPWRINDKPEKTRHGYAWQFFDATPDSHGLYFYYYKGSREGAIPRAQLRGYRGAIQTDGYRVYDYFEQQENVILLACMAHMRRKFIEAQNSHPVEAGKGLEYISLFYELEANLKDSNASFEQIAYERQTKALPIMDAMEQWMLVASNTCTPSDLMGKALDYAYKLWPRMRRYTENGIYHIDNNPVERHQRPSVMGRKNYLFSKNDRGAEDNAVFYSLLGSCDVVGINALEWLTYTLNHVKPDMNESELEKLLPHNYKESRE